MGNNIHKLSKDGVRLARHPMAVHGFFIRYRTLTRWILISLFFLLPWIKVNGLPSILINIPDRRFTFFWMSFWGHDTPLFFFVLASFTLGLLFVTSAWGRVWCGWACPQTIGIDGIFRQIEVLVEGNHAARLKLDRVPETVQFGETIEDHMFIKFPQSVLDKKGQMTFQLHIVAKSKKGRETLRKDIHLVGPGESVLK